MSELYRASDAQGGSVYARFKRNTPLSAAGNGKRLVLGEHETRSSFRILTVVLLR
jgi:hypothetical protein